MRSGGVKKGVARAHHRSLLKTLGITDEEMKKIFIGIPRQLMKLFRAIFILNI
jgi:dihydroxyacid dehydratase/phosphogluconate dehydratase